MTRALVVLPSGTYRAADFLAAARALGLAVVVASDHRQAMAEAMGDRALQLPLEDPESSAEAIVEAAGRAPLDAVISVDDQGSLAAALASGRLGLRGNPVEAVAATRDKAAQRRAFAAAGVAQPDFAVALAGDDAGEVASALGFPCVVKPTTLSASRGVIRADDAGAARAAAKRARAVAEAAGEAPGAPLLVERFVPGGEVAVEAILREGHLDVLAVFDKPDPLDGPYFEETIYTTPSRLAVPRLDAVRHLVAEAVAALGLVEGPVHAEVRTDERQARMIEVAARTIGGLCSRALSFGGGRSLEELVLAHAAGIDLGPVPREAGASGVMMLPIPGEGVLAGVGGVERARSMPGITGIEISVAPGRLIRPLPEGDRYLGFLFAKADTPQDVEAALRSAHSVLDVRIDR